MNRHSGPMPEGRAAATQPSDVELQEPPTSRQNSQVDNSWKAPASWDIQRDTDSERATAPAAERLTSTPPSVSTVSTPSMQLNSAVPSTKLLDDDDAQGCGCNLICCLAHWQRRWQRTTVVDRKSSVAGAWNSILPSGRVSIAPSDRLSAVRSARQSVATAAPAVEAEQTRSGRARSHSDAAEKKRQWLEQVRQENARRQRENQRRVERERQLRARAGSGSSPQKALVPALDDLQRETASERNVLRRTIEDFQKAVKSRRHMKGWRRVHEKSVARARTKLREFSHVRIIAAKQMGARRRIARHLHDSGMEPCILALESALVALGLPGGEEQVRRLRLLVDDLALVHALGLVEPAEVVRVTTALRTAMCYLHVKAHRMAEQAERLRSQLPVPARQPASGQAAASCERRAVVMRTVRCGLMSLLDESDPYHIEGIARFELFREQLVALLKPHVEGATIRHIDAILDYCLSPLFIALFVSKISLTHERTVVLDYIERAYGTDCQKFADVHAPYNERLSVAAV